LIKRTYFISSLLAFSLLMLVGPFIAHADNAAAGAVSLPAVQEAAAENIEPVPNASYETDVTDYQINPLDLIEIKVLQVPDMARSVRVDARGNISLPLIGVIQAEGLTSYGLEQVITKALAVDMLRDPQVSVFIKEFTSQRVTIQGLVKKPGIYEFPGRATLLQAVSMGGGLDERADQNQVRVISRAPNSGGEQTVVYNLEKIQEEGQADPILKSGDVVMVVEAEPIVVEGAVTKPGVFYPRGRATLMQVISQSGGLTDLANADDIKVFALNKEGQKIMLAYDLDQIREGKIPDPEIRPGNIVVVDKSAGRSAINSLTNTLRGFIGFGNPFGY
jgi:polysaccharide export outer membrane protein